MSVGAQKEEAQKKNTDCVYFLASPLTCKKGHDCEFRHSESARNNPRDCWYWLSGACLNPHCAFRHPPLEGLPEGESAGTNVALAGKSRVPCYYFIQGYCAKGDRCVFMHGLPTAAPTLPKPSFDKTENMPENQVSAMKGNGSVISGDSFDAHEAPAHLGCKPNQEVEATPNNRLHERSDSSVPTRPFPHQSEGLKEASASSARVEQVQALENRLLHQEAQTEEETLCAYQPEDVRHGGARSGEDHAQDGTESEELWEESSFDVLVDDGGTGQFIYADELEHCDGLIGPLQAGMLGTEGFVDFDYDHLGGYSEYGDTSANYEVATYDAYEQQLLHERFSSYEHNDGVQSIEGGYEERYRQGMLLRNSRRDVPCDGEASRPPKDLRNHIVKRRRAEKRQNYGEDYRRKHQGNGFIHDGRHQGGYSRQQNVPGQCHGSPTPRSNRQFQGRGESVVTHHIHGRLGEQQATGTRSAYRVDGASDQEDTRVGGPGKRFRGLSESFSRGKVKRERVRPRVVEVDEVLGNSRGPPSQHKKRGGEEVMKEGFFFAGPKTLAQIKAEKMKAMENGSSDQEQESLGSGSNNTMRRQNAQVRRRFSSVQGSVDEFLLPKELGKTLRPPKEMETDFEAPKPLSMILKEKRRVGENGAAKEEREEETLVTDTKRRSFLSDFPQISSNFTVMQLANRSLSQDGKTRMAKGAVEHGYAPSFLSNDKGEMEGVRLDKDVDDPKSDPEDPLNTGDSVMEFEEDDEDDFARKLGGF